MVIKSSKHKSGILYGPWLSFSYICMEEIFQEAKEILILDIGGEDLGEIIMDPPGFTREELSEYIDQKLMPKLIPHKLIPQFFLVGDDFYRIFRSISLKFKEYQVYPQYENLFCLGEYGETGIFIIYCPDFPSDCIEVCWKTYSRYLGVRLRCKRYKLIKS